MATYKQWLRLYNLRLKNKLVFFFFFFFRLLPIRDHHSAKGLSTSTGRLRLLRKLQPFPCLLLPTPSTFTLAFLFSFYLAPPSPSSFFPRSLFLSFSRGHTIVALHSEVCFLALSFSRSLSRIRFLSCPFLSLPVPISPFSTLQLPFYPPVFPSLPPLVVQIKVALVPVPSPDKWRGLRQEGHPA